MTQETTLYPSDQDLQMQAQMLASQRIEQRLGGTACAHISAEALAAVYRDQVVSLRAVIDQQAEALAAQAEKLAARSARKASE